MKMQYLSHNTSVTLADFLHWKNDDLVDSTGNSYFIFSMSELFIFVYSNREDSGYGSWSDSAMYPLTPCEVFHLPLETKPEIVFSVEDLLFARSGRYKGQFLFMLFRELHVYHLNFWTYVFTILHALIKGLKSLYKNTWKQDVINWCKLMVVFYILFENRWPQNSTKISEE